MKSMNKIVLRLLALAIAFCISPEVLSASLARPSNSKKVSMREQFAQEHILVDDDNMMFPDEPGYDEWKAKQHPIIQALHEQCYRKPDAESILEKRRDAKIETEHRKRLADNAATKAVKALDKAKQREAKKIALLEAEGRKASPERLSRLREAVIIEREDRERLANNARKAIARARYAAEEAKRLKPLVRPAAEKLDLEKIFAGISFENVEDKEKRALEEELDYIEGFLDLKDLEQH